MKKVYPIILTPDKGTYIVYIPDLKINTQGEDIADAINMARDAIGLWGITTQDNGKSIPEPSTINPTHDSNEIVTLVDIDFAVYRRANEIRTIRKNVTIPSWINEKAEAEGINFSAVLQEGLKKQLGL